MDTTISALLQELENDQTTHLRRLQIGEWLEQNGDPRPGVGVKDGIPDIAWLPVAPGGTVTVTRVWEPETPDEVARVTDILQFSAAPFFISKYLVTYAQYQSFVEAEDGYSNLFWWQDMPEACRPQGLEEQRTKKRNNPRDSVSWYQCVAFARWMNHRLRGLELPYPSGSGMLRAGDNAQVRLPAEWEWQWAAQNGAEERPYPWGAKKTGYANTGDAGLKQSIAVGMYPYAAAACGALDMSGNIMEWCANDKKNAQIIDVASSAAKVLRGGDWAYGIEFASCTRADDEDPARIDPLNGFRLLLGPGAM